MRETFFPTLISYVYITYLIEKKWKNEFNFILNGICKNNEEKHIYKKIKDVFIYLMSSWMILIFEELFYTFNIFYN